MGYKDEEIMAEKKAAALKKIQELEGKKLEAQLKESIYDECIHVDDGKRGSLSIKKRTQICFCRL